MKAHIGNQIRIFAHLVTKSALLFIWLPNLQLCTFGYAKLQIWYKQMSKVADLVTANVLYKNADLVMKCTKRQI